MPTKIDLNAGPLPKTLPALPSTKSTTMIAWSTLAVPCNPSRTAYAATCSRNPCTGIDINQVSKIEYATFQSQADLYLMEVYYINLWKPPLNKDDKAHDALTITLPEVEWKLFTTHLWDKWKAEIAESDREEQLRRQAQIAAMELPSEMRRKRRSGEITEEEYDAFLNELAECKERGDCRQLLRFYQEQKNAEV